MTSYNRRKKEKGAKEPEIEMGETQEIGDGTDKEVPIELAKITHELQRSIDKMVYSAAPFG
jgi:hypothetical protein